MTIDPSRIPATEEELGAATLWLLDAAGMDAAALTTDQMLRALSFVDDLGRYGPASPADLIENFGAWYVQDTVLEDDEYAATQAGRALEDYRAGRRRIVPEVSPRARELARARLGRPAGCRCVGLQCRCR